MLDSETKRRIDSARDILVGKVPDPKSQVEQITIALIYKFMDDMDKQSVAMDGKASFFKGEFKKYGWSEIFDPRLGGVEMLNLYGEAITRMSQNANLPPLFRDIFKNAYLPYRDPETLKLFLKTINDFTYDHSEKLGDAFEYLLSVLGSQGDAGQFRTPRHIIDFMVQVVDPKKNETVLDPACGTAGFLISAYKHIVKSSQESGKPLNAQDKQRLYENFTGYDISPDMVRLSLVNLYLHGFVKPQIHEYDTLASEDRWIDHFNVILANPPFMSPKGGIMPHKKFSVQSNRSEVLFVDYMAEHLTPNGRAAIIVPEGIIFQSAGAYKQLRKYLIEHNFLWAVVSLPSGVFNPYAGVKTSILFLDKSLAKKTDKVLFVKVENDGFDLGAQRRPIDKNDLPQTLKVLKSFRASILDGKTASFVPETDSPKGAVPALLVSISKLAETGDYILSADRYREVIRIGKPSSPTVKLDSIIELSGEKVKSQEVPVMSITMNYGLIDQGEKFKKRIASKDISGYKLVRKNEMVVGFPIDEGVIGFQKKYDAAAVSPAYDIWKLKRTDVNIDFLQFILRSDHARKLYRDKMRGTANRRRTITKEEFLKVEIPFPPLEVQCQLVDEIAAHQRIIDGAYQVVENWNPDIEIMTEWQTVSLSDIAEFKNGINFTKQSKGRQVKIIGVRHFQDHTIAPLDDLDEVVAESSFDKSYLLQEGDILFVRSNGNKALVGRSIMIPEVAEDITFSGFTIRCRLNKQAFPLFYAYLFKSEYYRNILKQVGVGANINNLSQGVLKEIEIPLPPLEIQREIVTRIETERAIVHGNRELVRLYEEKVKKVIERVWEG